MSVIVSYKIRDISSRGSVPDGTVELCQVGLKHFFDLGRTRVSSWRVVSSDVAPSHGNKRHVYKIRPAADGYNLYNCDYEYQSKNGRWKLLPYVLGGTVAKIFSRSGVRYVWLERRARG